MVSLIAHLIGHLLTPLVGRTFFRTVKRFPPAFAAVAVGGQGLGAWLVCECGPAGDWPMAGLGVLLLVFYTGLLGLVAVKWWAGTWGGFCDAAASQFEPAPDAEPGNVVPPNNALQRTQAQSGPGR